MAENEEIIIKLAKDLSSYDVDQVKQALTKLIKCYPNNTIIENLWQQYQDIKTSNKPADVQYKNGEIISHHEIQNRNEQDAEIKKNKNENDSDTEQQLAKNSFEIRQKVLAMQLNVVKTYFAKELIGNENVKMKEIILNMETSMSTVNTAIDFKHFQKAEHEFLKVETLCAELMKKVKKVTNKEAVKKKEVKKHVQYTEISDYRSLVTVRGTKEDITNCLLKAKTALENGKYDRAERLLLKAERISPTTNARDLLKQVLAAKESKKTPEPIEKATEAIQVNTAKEEERKSEDDTINAFKCLTAFEKAFASGNLKKAERMLRKAKKFDSSLNMEEKLYLVEATKINKIKEENEKVKRECKTDECQIKDIIKTGHEQTVTDSDIKSAEDCLYKTKKAYGAGNFREVERNLNDAKKYDPSLDLESVLSECRAIVSSRSSTETVPNHEKTHLVDEKRKETNMQIKGHRTKTDKGNESNNTEALTCIEIAQAAFKKGQYDRAVNFLLKSLKICHSQAEKSILETQKHDSSLEEEYNKYVELAINAVAQGNLATAERFHLKAIGVILKHEALQSSSNHCTTNNGKGDADPKREREAEMYY